MTQQHESYDIHIERNGVWTIEFMSKSYSEARRASEALMQQQNVTGMRLVRSRISAISGTVTEDMLVERIRGVPSGEPAIGAVQEAPECSKPSDLLKWRARYCIYLLLHEWLQAHEVGVLECLTTQRLFDQLLDRGSLVKKAVQRVAGLQTRPGEDIKRRIDILLSLIDEARRASQRHECPAHEAIDRLNRLHRNEAFGEGDAAIAALMSGSRTRFAKMMRLLGLLNQVENPAGLAVVDRWLSDYMIDESVSGELAGRQPFRAGRLERIAQAAAGQIGEGKPELACFGELIRAGVLGETRSAMVLSLDHALRLDTPLVDGTPPAERRAILRIVRRCSASFPEFLGGPRLAARLTDRFSALGRARGGMAFAEAMETIAIDLDTCPEQLCYLWALLAGSRVESVKRRLLQQIDNVLRLYGGLERYFAEQPTVDAVKVAASTIVDRMGDLGLGPRLHEAWCGAIHRAAAADLARRAG